MSDTSTGGKEQVFQFISEHEPVDQDAIVQEFGRRGISSLRTLMSHNRVSYSLDWKLVVDSRGIDTDT